MGQKDSVKFSEDTTAMYMYRLRHVIFQDLTTLRQAYECEELYLHYPYVFMERCLVKHKIPPEGEVLKHRDKFTFTLLNKVL